jgi:uncharacterized protein
MSDKLRDSVHSLVEAILRNAPGCHDFDHTLRVLNNAKLIAKMEKLSEEDSLIVELGALLHDIARPEEMESNGKLCHARLGVGKAMELLRKAGCEDEILLKAVSLCVGRHRYRGSDKPESLPEKVIYDADKLDSIGAIGIGRAFHFAGRIGARLHNTEEEAMSSESYSREDSAYREYLVKLRHVPERMLTESGRRLAVRRSAFMKTFFSEVENEIAGHL